MPHQPKAIANEFLRMQGDDPFLTHMHVQKLTSIAHGWTLATLGERLVAERAQAWDNGPVFPSLWDALKHKGKNVISDLVRKYDVGLSRDNPIVRADLAADERDILKRVWRRYSEFDAFELSDLTHQPGTPWYKAYYTRGRNTPLLDSEIRKHYEDLALAGRRRIFA